MSAHGHISELLRNLFGHRLGADELVAVFSVRLDESGTDGRSPYTAVAGAVATTEQWDALEKAWNLLLKSRKVRAFHNKEFRGRSGGFQNWSNLKSTNFEKAVKRIIKKNTEFRIAVGVENSVHAEIKEKMRGVKGFNADSNYGLCLRYLMFLASMHVPQGSKIMLMLEDGPWAKGAISVYTKVSRMTGKWKPARYAHMLDGITVLPKGRTRTLEAADYLVGVAHQRMLIGEFTKKHHPQVSILLKRSFLERWYEGMIKEKEHRRAYQKKTFRNPALLN